MHTENHIHFTDELISRTGFYLWVHSAKCKMVRIVFYILMLISSILAIAGFLRVLVLKTDWTMTIVFLLTLLLLFASVILIWPLVYRAKAINGIHREIDQVVTLDERYINLHTSLSHQQYKWHIFTDIHEDERYYFLFSPDVYIILDKTTFPPDGEEIFRSMHKPARLLKEASRKTINSRCLMIFSSDYLTPIVNFFSSLKKN